MAQLKGSTRELVPESYVHWQDYRTHHFGDPPPPVAKENFKTQDAANERKKVLQSMGMVACVVPTTVRRKFRQ